MIKKIKPYFCSNCRVNLRGKPIPKKEQHLFGADYFGREIGQYDMEQDITVSFICPNCGHNPFVEK